MKLYDTFKYQYQDGGDNSFNLPRPGNGRNIRALVITMIAIILGGTLVYVSHRAHTIEPLTSMIRTSSNTGSTGSVDENYSTALKEKDVMVDTEDTGLVVASLNLESANEKTTANLSGDVANFVAGAEIDEFLKVSLRTNECSNDADCIRLYEDKLPYCATQNNFPPNSGIGLYPPLLNTCHDCLQDRHCESDFKHCLMRVNDAKLIIGISCQYFTPDNPLPGINLVTLGYNVYKGDPLFLEDETSGLTDPGIPNFQLFELLFTTSPNELPLDGKMYAIPEGIAAFQAQNSVIQTVTKSSHSSHSFQVDTNSTVSIGGNATAKKFSLGGSVGISAYMSVYTNAFGSTTTTSSSATSGLYSFSWRSDALMRLSDYAQFNLEQLTTSGNWGEFFDKFGTHVVKSGLFGARSTVSYTFTESERETVTKASVSFESSMKLGIPLLLNVATDTEKEIGSEASTIIGASHSWERRSYEGDVKFPLLKQSIIRREITSSICDHIPFESYVGLSKDTCEEQLFQYCLNQLQNVGIISPECDFPKKFECTSDDHCRNKNLCHEGKCVRGIWVPGLSLSPTNYPICTIMNSCRCACEYSDRSKNLVCDDNFTPGTRTHEQLRKRLILAGWSDPNPNFSFDWGKNKDGKNPYFDGRYWFLEWYDPANGFTPSCDRPNIGQPLCYCVAKN